MLNILFLRVLRAAVEECRPTLHPDNTSTKRKRVSPWRLSQITHSLALRACISAALRGSVVKASSISMLVLVAATLLRDGSVVFRAADFAAFLLE